MYKFTKCFLAAFLLLSLLMLFCVMYFNLPQLISGNKIVLFALLNALMLVGVGIFFILFKEKLTMYIENYGREK